MPTVQLQGLAQAQRRLQSLPKQMRFGAARGINEVAFKVRQAMVDGMQKAFDRPTPFILKSPWVGLKATPQRLESWIYPRDPGGKAVDPANVLRASVTGGPRKLKRFERALQRIGVLLPGLVAVPAPRIVAGREGDGYGGVKGSFIVRLLSYLQAFGEQGFRANMTERNRKRLSRKGRWSDGRFVANYTKAYGKAAAARAPMAVGQGGVEYFVSRGRGEFTGRGSWKNGQQQHLPAGIWERSGLYGGIVKPVFYFSRPASYTKRLPLQEIGDEVVSTQLPGAVQARISDAVRTAR